MIMHSEIELSAAKQLAIDYCCKPDDFFSYGDIIAQEAEIPGQRLISGGKDFRIATMGMGSVICCAPELSDAAQRLLMCFKGAELFSGSALHEAELILSGYGLTVLSINQYFLPETPYRPNIRSEGLRLVVFEGEDLKNLYSLDGFENALIRKAEGERRDILAVAAVSARSVLGIAGAVNDSRSFAQIGVDVLQHSRGMGVGSAVVSACANELLCCGYIPYYGTWSGNVISCRLAGKRGFYPAWCEVRFGKQKNG